MPASNAIIKKPDFSQSAQSSARNKPLPQNIEAEESVLAACMLNGMLLSSVPKIRQGLRSM